MHRSGVVALLLLPSLGWAADTAVDRSSLRGLKAFKVVIDRLDPELERDGLTVGRLQNQIEERLRAAGIALDENAKEFLGLTVTSVRGKRTPYALSFSLAMYQIVTLTRDPTIKSVAPTWEASDVFISAPKALREASGESIDTLVRKFIGAYKSAH